MTVRAGTSDLDEFAMLWEVRAEADQACADAIDRLRAKGLSWGLLAMNTGLTRQGLSQWHKRRPVQPGVNTCCPPEVRGPGRGETP
jgi:hypothetical protein